jgi:hypothetical protein
MGAGGEVVGYIAFAAVKYVGYSATATILNRAYGTQKNIWKVGLVRTGIGVLFGAAFGGAWMYLSHHYPPNVADPILTWLFFAPLLPIRLVEWGLLIHLFFDRGLVRRRKDLEYAAYGIVWSFVLDALGIVFAFVVPGGFWVC